MSKTILFTVGWPLSYGGHIQSLMAFSKYLHRIGYKIHILAPDGINAERFHAMGAVVHINESINNKQPRNLVVALDIIRLHRIYQFDIIHAQDPRSLYPSYIASAVLPTLFAYTEAGGPGPHIYLPPHCPIISYSKEVTDFISLNFSYLIPQLYLIKGRIDTELNQEITAVVNQDTSVEAIQQIENITIFMAMRFDLGKRRWLTSLFAAIEDLCKEEKSISFVIAGDGNLFHEFKKRSNSINEHYGRNVANLLGAIYDVNRLYKHYEESDIIIGHGRGVLEAMACSRPVIVISPNGHGTIVDETSANIVSEFNFSGRHMIKHPELTKDLAQQIKRLAIDSALRKHLGSFSKRYITSVYNAEIGAKQLSQVYTSTQKDGYINKLLNLLSWIIREGLIRRIHRI